MVYVKMRMEGDVGCDSQRGVWCASEEEISLGSREKVLAVFLQRGKKKEGITNEQQSSESTKALTKCRRHGVIHKEIDVLSIQRHC